MFRPRIIPALLIRDGGLVKTIKFKDATYVGDPMNAVRLFNKLHADELVFLDIDAEKEGRTMSRELVQRIGAEASMPFAVGGGIRTLADAKELITAGAEKVVLNTAAIEHPELVREIAEQFGSQSVIVSIDAKKDLLGRMCVAVRGGKKSLGITPWDHAREMEKLGAGEILINSVERDGTGEGYDIPLIRRVADTVQVPVIAFGGAGKQEHLRAAVVEGGASAMAAGSMFVFYGARHAVLINYPTKEEKNKLFLTERA